MDIRTPKLHEKAQWLPLWQGYLTFYKSEVPLHVIDLTWQRLNDPSESLFCIGAYDDDIMIGFATYGLQRSTWSETYYCYLEDLFVSAVSRSKGVARKLIEAVKQAANENECSRLYWVTQEGNKTARALYDKLAKKTDFMQYRMPLP